MNYFFPNAIKFNFLFFSFLIGINISAQVKDTVNLSEINITTYKSMNGIGRMKDDDGQIIYAGKKNEVLVIDSLDANKAVNNTRQIIGRIPGLNIMETESGGFTANGIGFRGLNPYQSLETNSRQNGYTISADIFGYNEAYYLPPMEAVKSITFLRGASSLAFGPQMGGMINYELKTGSKKPFEFSTSQTAGNFGLYNSYNSVGGTYKKINYFGFIQYRKIDGWRENSDQQQLSGFASVKINFTKKFSVGFEYTALRNKIHMPGGLTDSSFAANPQQSGRGRNWLNSPWNIVASNFNYKISEKSSLSLKSAYMFSQRNLTWLNEDGWPDTKDVIDSSTLKFPLRELEREFFNGFTNELRFLSNYNLGKIKSTFSAGVRYAYTVLNRYEGMAKGQKAIELSSGTSFFIPETSNSDTSMAVNWDVNMKFQTTNIAAYVENNFYLGKKISITPGFRLEYLSTIVSGQSQNKAGDSNEDYIQTEKQINTRKFLLGAFGMQYKITESTNFYANYSQSYKPVTYSDLTPFGTVAKIDRNLRDATGDNADFGYRGSIKNILNFDLGIFYLNYRNKIGVIEKTQDTLTYLFRTNTGNAVHKGIESYVEINILDGLIKSDRLGKLSVYNSFAYVDARYTEGEFKDKQVEYAPKYINRTGINYSFKNFSVNFQYSYKSSSYGDANNTIFSSDALVGIIPANKVFDLSSSYKISAKFKLKFGVNNISDAKYFTMRTNEYPGPGIIPSVGRMFYGGISATF